jgi:hypothetical protein
MQRHRGHGVLVAVTNDPEGPLAADADLVLPLHAGTETGGVACITFMATLAVLHLLAGVTAADLRAAVAAASALRDARTSWLADLVELLRPAHTVYAIAPAERISSALQSALALREGPRLAAGACETGDWLHVDVYLSKRPGYTALLFPGSRFDREVMQWCAERGARIAAVGRPVAGATLHVPFPHARTGSSRRSWKRVWPSSRRRSSGVAASKRAIPRLCERSSSEPLRPIEAAVLVDRAVDALHDPRRVDADPARSVRKRVQALPLSVRRVDIHESPTTW